MKLEIIQHSHLSINSCYIFKNFLDNLDYLNIVKNKIKELTIKDEMQHSTNVKANMTSYGKLLEEEEFNSLHKKILETIAICFQLRTPHQSPFNLKMTNSWGMLHKQNERSVLHCHQACDWSAAFYLQIPHQTIFRLPEFDAQINLEDNLLVFFRGITQHSVDPFQGEGERISMACNINQEFK